MLDLEPIKNALNAIAPQPWTWAPDCDQVWAVRDAEGGDVAEANMTRGLGSAHGQFIADAPAYVAALLAEVSRLEDCLDRARCVDCWRRVS
jgi:hypothetical protein